MDIKESDKVSTDAGGSSAPAHGGSVWADYRHLLDCYISAGALSVARELLVQIERARAKENIQWSRSDEIEYWILKAEITLLSRGAADTLGVLNTVEAAAPDDAVDAAVLDYAAYGEDSCRQGDIVDLPESADTLAQAEALIEALKICCSRDGLPAHLAERIALLGVLLCERRGQNLEVLEGAEKAAGAFPSSPDYSATSRIFLAAGRAAARLRRHDDVERFLRKALDSASLSNRPEARAQVLLALGRHLSQRGRVAEAAPLLLTALDMQTRGGLLREGLATRVEVARLRQRQGCLHEALGLYEEAIRISRLLGLGRVELAARIDVGLLRTWLSQMRQARQDLLMSIRQARRLSVSAALIRAYGCLAVTYARMGVLEKARRFLSLANRVLVLVEPGPGMRAEFEIHAAEVYLALGELDAAAQRARAAVSLADRHHLPVVRAEGWRLRGETLLADRRWAEAAEAIRGAERLFAGAQEVYGRGIAEVALGRALLCMARSPEERTKALRIRARGIERLERSGVPTDSPGALGEGRSGIPTGARAAALWVRGDRRGGVARSRPPGPEQWAEYGIITCNTGLHVELLHASRVAPTLLPVLIHGETGSGKELVARAIHRMSGRDGSFAVFNAGTCRGELFEAELFGHCKGAFTGAYRDRQGLVAQAEGGTLFLDEIADLSSSAQATLLRFLDSGEVRPVGSDTIRTVKTRIIAASHRTLSRMVARGRFRQDLFFRLAGAEIRLPSLRVRREDIIPLVRHFARRRIPVGVLEEFLSAGFSERLVLYPWPGNVRQLSHWVDQLSALIQGDLPRSQIVRAMERAMETAMQSNGASAGGKLTPPGATGRPSREELIRLLVLNKGNISAVAQDLYTYRTRVYRLLKSRGIDFHKYRLEHSGVPTSDTVDS